MRSPKHVFLDLPPKRLPSLLCLPPLAVMYKRVRLTFERRETSIEDQFQIAELTFIEDNGRERLCLCGELISAWGITGNQILEDTAYS